MKVLLVEDQARMGRYISRALAEHGYTVQLVGTCAGANDALAESCFDVVVLDLGLPDGDGIDLLHDWRESGFNEPVLILSARDAVEDRIVGLNIGADAYLPKPFSLEELIATVRALIRRQSTQKRSLIKHRGLKLDTLEHSIELDGKPLTLTNREFTLLEIFLQNAGRLLTRTYLTERIWSDNFDVDTNLLDVYMSRLRARLEVGGERYFRTVRGVGYQLI